MQPIDGSLCLFLQACEMFILELTLRSWNHSEENKRRTLQRNDIAAAITRTDIFDFLVSTSAVLPAPKGQICDAMQHCTLGWYFGLKSLCGQNGLTAWSAVCTLQCTHAAEVGFTQAGQRCTPRGSVPGARPCRPVRSLPCSAWP